MSSEPIFIGGMFKSGTTLLRNLLGQHPLIYAGFETKWMLLRDETKRKERLDILAKLYDWEESDVVSLWQEEKQAESFLESFMKKNLARAGKSRWVEKSPENVAFIDDVLAYWPQAKFLHIVRDPRDVFVGRREAKGLTLEHFVEVYDSLFQPSYHWLGTCSENYMELRYEDLVADTEMVMRQVSHFVKVPWDEVISFYQGNSNDYKIVKEITGKEQTTLKKLTNPMTDAYVGRWKNEITQKEAKFIQDKLFMYMKPFKYFDGKILYENI